MKSLTGCQANRTRVRVKIVRRHLAKCSIESPTFYTANRTRLRMQTAISHPGGPGMKSPTGYQANVTQVGGKINQKAPGWT